MCCNKVATLLNHVEVKTTHSTFRSCYNFSAVCDQHGHVAGHVADNCPIETLSIEQATHIYAGTSSTQPSPV